MKDEYNTTNDERRKRELKQQFENLKQSAAEYGTATRQKIADMDKETKQLATGLTKKVAGGSFAASEYIINKLLSKIGESASMEQQYLNEAFRVINRYAVKEADGDFRINGGDKIYSFSNSKKKK